MAGRRHQFRGQFGINETELTIAIRNGDYELAEEIIETTTDLAYLNDGPYQNVPLHMVLTNNHSICLTRNLKLAKLLVQKGANPNLRIPYIDFDRTSPSPFEELVVCYEVLRYFVNGKFNLLSEELEMYVGEDEILVVFVNNTIDLEGNWCTAIRDDCDKLIEQTYDLIGVFLENGGNPNVITTFRQKTLFHWVIEHDPDLGKRFLKTCRVDVNLRDVHGNSPLMGAILSNGTKDSLSLYEAMCDMVESVDVNSPNCVGETALFHSCLVGAVEVASKLCDNGAKIDSTVCVTQVPILYPNECKCCASSIPYPVCYLPSPLLAPLLSNATVRSRYAHVASYDSNYSETAPHKHLTDKIIMSSMSPLIDSLHLKCLSGAIDAAPLKSLFVHLKSLLAHINFDHLRINFDHLGEGRIAFLDFTTLMFGQLSAGLQQLCIRTIFDHVLLTSQIPKKKWPDFAPRDFCIKDCKGALLESYMTDLVEMLELPQSFKIFFDIEAAKYQLCKIIMSFQCLVCQQACSESDLSVYDDGEESTDSSDVSSDYNASIILFSSDILSEESSEEVDDLSDEDFSDSEDDKEPSEASGDAGDGVRVRRKVRCNYESLSSSSEDIRVIVETLCEDVAENMAQKQHSSKCPCKYQRLEGECSNSPPTSSNCTSPSSSSSSELALKVSAKEESLSDST